MPTFENRFFQFDLDMQQAAWGLRKNEDQVSIQSTFPQIIYLDGNHRKQIKLEAGTEFSIITSGDHRTWKLSGLDGYFCYIGWDRYPG